jgi:hypothetical protein
VVIVENGELDLAGLGVLHARRKLVDGELAEGLVRSLRGLAAGLRPRFRARGDAARGEGGEEQTEDQRSLLHVLEDCTAAERTQAGVAPAVVGFASGKSSPKTVRLFTRWVGSSS